MTEPSNASVFTTVFIYCAFIIFAPITSFFISKIFFFEGILHTSNVTSNVWSAVVAVIVLHIALGLYIYKAYFEADKVKPQQKID